MSYELFEHTADLGLRVSGPDLETVFADAARGLFSMIVPDLDSVRLLNEASFSIEEMALDLLLFDWLNELLYVYETRRLLLAGFHVTVADGLLRGTARGEPLDRKRHALDHEVKAITYHGLKLERTDKLWLAEIIVDI
jgi:SHS2 domain-containing protein